MQDTQHTDSDTDADRTANEQEVLKMLAELDKLTDDGRIKPDDYHVSHRQSYIEHDGTRLVWNTNGDGFVRVYNAKYQINYNFNVGPYSLDWRNKRGATGLDVAHRDDNPGAYNQTSDMGNLLDTERVEKRDEIIAAAEALADETAYSQAEAEIVEAHVRRDYTLEETADVLALRERTVETRFKSARETTRRAEQTVALDTDTTHQRQ